MAEAGRKRLDPDFADELIDEVKEMKADGTSEEDAARTVELKCGKAGQEFNPYGQAVVKSIYGGAKIPDGTIEGTEKKELKKKKVK